MSSPALEEEDLPTHTGPKGVIHDWRKFKLESEDHETVTPNRRELLRQMSNPQKPEESRERASRKMSTQEYELIKEEDEKCLRKYRKQCMQEMHERLSFGPRFDGVYELENGEAFLDVIEKEHRLTLVVVHIYEDGVEGCEALNNCLTCLAAEYPTVKFCRIKASCTGAGDRFSDNVLPTMLVYKAGELLGNFLRITQHLNEEFFAVDVEAFLNEYGLLPEKEFAACPNDEQEADVE
ncbi:phosducin-like [Scleropages formosus]|uniref:Phosducin n=2 Tax=Scleropages formosus TaxID=113540 RepID=A0A0P7XEG0_SCLFO|nr:phosducin-like [Scleropages formosus]KPP73778.1 phosducin-like [Scleropages formosus]